MSKISKGSFPEDFNDQAIAVFEVLHMVMGETTEAAKGDGIDNDQLVSAIMSATITELVNIMGCPHCVAKMMANASMSLMEAAQDDEGRKEHESVH